MKSKKEMVNAMNKVAQALPPSSARAQAYNIGSKIQAHFPRKSIAQIMSDDHVSDSHARRHCYLLVDAGLAKETGGTKNCFGTFECIDGSQL